MTRSSPVNGVLGDADPTGRIADNDPKPALTVWDAVEWEGDSGAHEMVIAVTLSAASGRTVAVNDATVNGTAASPGDFTAASGTLMSFAPGQTTQLIVVEAVS